MTLPENPPNASGAPTDQMLGAYLAALRQAAGLDLPVLARQVSLSVAQLRQLEAGEGSLFYSRAVRQHAARKVVTHLGGDLAQVADAAPPQPAATALQAPAAAGPEGGGPARQEPGRSPLAQPSVPDPRPARRWPRLTAAGLALAAVLLLAAGLAGRWAETPHGAAQDTAAAARIQATTVAEAESVDRARTSQAGLPAASAPEPGSAAPAQADAGQALQAPSPTAGDASAQGAPAHARAAANAGCPQSLALPSTPTAALAPTARRPGNKVYVVSEVDQLLCIADASGRVRTEPLVAGRGRGFLGDAPWLLQAAQLGQTQIYFQGWKVRPPEGTQERLRLVERP